MADAAGRRFAEEGKLLDLARGARARASAAQGAAVLDDIGRSYAAGSVDLPSLKLTALQAAVAAAVSSGSTRLDAAVLVGASAQLSTADRACLEDMGSPRLLVFDAAGGAIAASGHVAGVAREENDAGGPPAAPADEPRVPGADNR